MVLSNAGAVYGFNVTVPRDMEKLSKRLEVPLKNYNVIYQLMDDIKVVFLHKDLVVNGMPSKSGRVAGKSEAEKLITLLFLKHLSF